MWQSSTRAKEKKIFQKLKGKNSIDPHGTPKRARRPQPCLKQSFRSSFQQLWFQKNSFTMSMYTPSGEKQGFPLCGVGGLVKPSARAAIFTKDIRVFTEKLGFPCHMFMALFSLDY